MNRLSPLELARNKRYAEILEIALLRKLADILDEFPKEASSAGVLLPALITTLVEVARSMSADPKTFEAFKDIAIRALKVVPWKDHGA